MKAAALALAATLAAVPAVSAQTIMTTLSNNGSGGIFLELTPATQTLQVNSVDTYFGSAAGSAVTVEVWTRPGSYAGFTASNAGWTLSQTLNGVSAGTTALANLAMTTPIALPLGGPTSIYLHSITAGGGIRYTGLGTAPPQTTWINADITLFSDISRTGAVPFGGTQFTPRTFAGNVNYSPVPAPGVLGAMGLAGLFAARRRRG